MTRRRRRDPVEAALDRVGMSVIPIKDAGTSFYNRDTGKRLGALRDLEAAGFALYYIGPGRCTSLKREPGGRSWRCSLPTGHDGKHRSRSGRRSWPSSAPAPATDAGHTDLGAGLPPPGAQVTPSTPRPLERTP